MPLEAIRTAIPSTMPKNPPQTCSVGVEVVITLTNGRTLRYGPCDRAASIERLRLALTRAFDARARSARSATAGS